MKSYSGLFPQIVSMENLSAATERAAKGKRDRGPVARFLADKEAELSALRNELMDSSYAPRPYVQFRIRDPKPRTISCADFRDRVVHHAICAHIGPIIDRRMIYDSYACRKGKGAHQAVLRAQRLLRRYDWTLKVDIRGFFDSVDHQVLKQKLARMFREQQLRALLGTIIDHRLPGLPAGKGLPIGNLTSQWFANYYLDEIDHLAREVWRVSGYVRYMDDFLILGRTRAEVCDVHGMLVDALCERLRLSLKPNATRVASAQEGVPFLGLWVHRGTLRMQPGRLHRARRLVRRRERACEEGWISEAEMAQSVGACLGSLSQFGLAAIGGGRYTMGSGRRS